MSGTNTQTSGPGGQWFVVDFARIMRLPERLRRLWPRELMPRAPMSRETISRVEPGGAASRAEPRGAASAGEMSGTEDSVMLEEMPDARTGARTGRGLDVLSAWLTGFAAELNLTQSRMAIVISSGAETVHLEIGVCEDTCLAILALRGEGFGEFEGFELLRRIRMTDLAQSVEDLGHLVEKDCVLTLSHMTTGGDSGLEFLHRNGDTWSRPTLQRCESGITVGAEVDAGAAAVRTLVAAALTRLCTAVPGAAAGPPGTAAPTPGARPGPTGASP